MSQKRGKYHVTEFALAGGSTIHECSGATRHDIFADVAAVDVVALANDEVAEGVLGTVAIGTSKSYSFACDKLKLTSAGAAVGEVRSFDDQDTD